MEDLKNRMSEFIDNENIIMTKEIEKELNNMENFKNEKGKFEMEQLKYDNEIILSIEDKINKILKENPQEKIKVQKTVEDLKIKYDANTTLFKYDGIEGTRYVIKETIEAIKESKDMFVRNIKNYICVALVRGYYNMYGINIPMYVDDTSNEIDLCNYEDCLLNWLDDTIEHFEDLYLLTSLDVEEFRTCIQNCYFELKILCYKIIYALRESCKLEYRINNSFDEEPEEKEKYVKLLSVLNQEELKKLCGTYSFVYDKVCSIGDYIFMYVNEYGV